MALFSKCRSCGKAKFSSSLDIKGECSVCAEKSRRELLARLSNANREAARKAEIEKIIDSTRHTPNVPHVIDGCALSYRYPVVKVNSVDRNILRKMVDNKDFRVDLCLDPGGDILLWKYNSVLGKLADRVQMCTDWISKKRPLVCEFAEFKANQEKVALFFYRSEIDEMARSSFETAKLTSCMSSAKQESIYCLVSGEKLFVELDDNDKPYVRDIGYNPLGKLPAKFNPLYDDGLIKGIYFDHSERVESEDWDKNDKAIPYIRIYIDRS